MTRKISKEIFFLAVIIALGFALRVYQVWSVPPSLNWDEVSHGYNAYSIIKTGRDEWGEYLPVIFRAYGDYKLPVYVYLTALSEIVFGLNAFAVRFPGVLFGTLSILFTYLLTKRMLGSGSVAMLSAALMAISPWSLFLSRAALEASVALSLIIAGIYCLLRGIEEKNWMTAVGIFLLGLSVWTYNSARVFVPLIMLLFVILFRKKLLSSTKRRWSYLVASILIALALFAPMFLQLANSQGQARYANVKIIDEGAVARINELRQNAELTPLLERIVFNKATYFVASFARNYLAHYSFDFLFLKGGDNYQFNVPGHGLMYLVNLPLFYYGIFIVFKGKKDRPAIFLLAWLLLSPVAASLTRESPHTLRSIVMMPAVMIFCAVGLLDLTRKLSRDTLITFIYWTVLLISFADYYHYYLTEYRNNYSFAWQYGYKEAVLLTKHNYDKYEKIIFSKKYGEPHEFVLFNYPMDPSKYLNDSNLKRFSQSNWYWVDKFDKFYFVNDWDIPEVGSKFRLESGEEFECASCLLLTTENNAPEGWRKLGQIDFLNGEVAFEIYEH